MPSKRCAVQNQGITLTHLMLQTIQTQRLNSVMLVAGAKYPRHSKYQFGQFGIRSLFKGVQIGAKPAAVTGRKRTASFRKYEIFCVTFLFVFLSQTD